MRGDLSTLVGLRRSIARALLVFTSFFVAMPAVAAERCANLVDLAGLPLVELPSKKPGDRFAVMISGDGGWRRIDVKVTDRLRDAGIPVVGFLAPDYFARGRTAEESACDLERVIRAYQLRWKRERVMLIGYSRGADVLPFMASRLPPELKRSIQSIALLGLEATIDFRYHSGWSLRNLVHPPKEPQYPVRPELEKLRGQRILCVYGEKEPDSLCRSLDAGLATSVREPGGHHFAGKYRDVADAIIRSGE